MSNWSVERYRVNARIRSVLVSNNVDLDRVTISAYPTRVYFRGHLSSSVSSERDYDILQVKEIFSEISRIPGVKNIIPQLDNWKKDYSGKWSATGTGKQDELTRDVKITERATGVAGGEKSKISRNPKTWDIKMKDTLERPTHITSKWSSTGGKTVN